MKYISLKSILLLGAALIISATPLHAQQGNGLSATIPQATPLSPEAAAIVQYVNYPVDYCTGLPQINIPLYEVKSGDVTLPISLSYRSSGFKPGEKSGWVGTGWVLDAEPGLVRTVNTIPDDAPNYGYLYSRPWDGNVTQEEMAKMCKGTAAELDPDKFYYKLLSQSGSFYFQRVLDTHHQLKEQFVTYPYDLLNVEGRYSAFNLRDKDGFLYNFGGDNNYEYCARSQEIANRSYKTRWMCNYIQSPKGRVPVRFTYTDMTEFVSFRFDESYILEDSIMGTGIGELPILTTPRGTYRVQPNGSLTPSGFRSNSQISPRITSNAITRKVLSDIKFDGGNVHFVNSNKSLKYFEVTDTEGKLVRRVDLYITPYNNQTSFTKLDSLRISAPGCADRVYRFVYYGVRDVPGEDVYRKVDHYGYYNGSTGQNVVPYVELESQYFSGDRMVKIKHNAGGPKGERDPRTVYAKCGILAQIASPEGVVTQFQYEPNIGGIMLQVDHDQWVEDYHEGGGVRINRITKMDANGQQESRFYDYTFDPVSGGTPYYGCMEPGYSFRFIYLPDGNAYMYEQKQQKIDNLGSSRYSRIRRISSSPISNIFHPNGLPIFYNHVKETITGNGPQEENVFYYTVPPSLWADYGGRDFRPAFAPFDPNGLDNFRYYKLFKTEKYIAGKQVEQREYKYGLKVEKGAQHIYQCKPFPYSTWENTRGESGAYYFLGMMTLENGCSRKTEELIIRYDDNGKRFKTVKTYDYDRSGGSGYTNTLHVSPVKITTTDSSGQTTTEEFMYPEDFDNATNLSQKLLIESNRYAVPLEYKITENGKTQVTRQKFEEEIFTRKDNQTEFESIGKFMYDWYGNIAYTCVEGELPDCYIWGYNHQYVIAKIEKCGYNELLTALGVTSQGFETYSGANKPSNTFMQKLNALREVLPESQVYTYTYEPLIGMSSMTTPDGMSIYYENDSFGRLLERYYYENGKKIVLEKHDYNTPDNKDLLR